MKKLSVPRRAAIITLAVVMIALLVEMGSAQASRQQWAARVCDEVAPAASSALADAQSWPTVTSSATTVDDVVGRVRVVDRALGGLISVLRAMRLGIRHAGVPPVPHGARVATETRSAIGQAQAKLQTVRDATSRFEDEFDADPGAAMDELSGVFAGGFKLDLPAVRWPTSLKSAFDRSARCREVRGTLDEFVNLIRRKLGG